MVASINFSLVSLSQVLNPTRKSSTGVLLPPLSTLFVSRDFADPGIVRGFLRAPLDECWLPRTPAALHSAPPRFQPPFQTPLMESLIAQYLEKNMELLAS